jgi:hypothetical protein
VPQGRAHTGHPRLTLRKQIEVLISGRRINPCRACRAYRVKILSFAVDVLLFVSVIGIPILIWRRNQRRKDKT